LKDWRNPLMAMTLLVFGLGITFVQLELEPKQFEPATIDRVVPSTSSLKPGIYWGGGSRYITIEVKNGQFWFKGSSRITEFWEAPLSLEPNHASRYRVNGSDLVVQQLDDTTLLFDNMRYQLEAT